MIIRNIEVSQFRNYSRCSADFSAELNWIYGANGQGKTNLVEAVHYLCNLESFRTKKPAQLLQENKTEAVIQAELERQRVQHQVSIKVSKKGRQVVLDRSPSHRVSEYILSFMALAFTPEDVNLFRNVPQERRKFFNRIMTFVDPVYFKNLQEYTKILAQKNSLLRQGLPEQIPLWNEMLVRSAIKIMQQRSNFVEQMNAHLHDLFMELSGRSEKLTLVYKPSLNSNDLDEKIYLLQLEKSLQRDLQYGFAVLGPHRDEYHLLIDEKKDKDFFSQGEFRITNLSLKMTINRLLCERYKFYPVLIFDDLFSELDEEVIQQVSQYFIKLKNQIFVTSTSEPSSFLPGKNFHIKKGQLV
ncbi:MAG: DNA replication and repair protein RecF [SAR324 cluster bacterium]|nr:DNA replication and repair protein RecF [SAR324 cluster bacterium]MDP7046357.1 DNA replication and repair protein RecF [SAR324 cluster bacterium]MEC8980717.1 DNA replication and repair protein RecF [SAR324 cluster bacterium]MED5435982.1 DNA replication and repair protein RecF [SAR324 cluster bacterium]